MLLCLQICYGIIYGMGAKSLGEQMGVDENDAACYIESFKARYKGIHWGFPTTHVSILVISLILAVYFRLLPWCLLHPRRLLHTRIMQLFPCDFFFIQFESIWKTHAYSLHCYASHNAKKHKFCIWDNPVHGMCCSIQVGILRGL